MEQISKPALVIVGTDSDGTLAESSAKLLRLARSLTTGDVYALSIEASADTQGIAQAGAKTLFIPASAGYSPRNSQAIAEVALAALAQIAQDSGEGEGGDVVRDTIGFVLTSGTYMGRALTAILAATLHVGGGTDVSEVTVEDGSILAAKSALSGSWLTQFRATEGFPVLAVRPGAGVDEGAGAPSTAEVGNPEVTVLELAPPLSDAVTSVEVVSSTPEPEGARVSLTDADVVVVGGRGVEGDYGLVEKLADALGGAVGATRVACDEGWVGRSAQIGQTGLNIAPKLYIGLGVSGAVHHTCGILGSETIVAVVDDPDAPIVEIADFTVIGDLFDIVPQALEALAADA